MGKRMRSTILAVTAALVIGAPVQALAQAKGRPVVAIYQIDDLTQSGQGPALSTMLQTAIEGTSKFRVMEREQMAKLVGEQSRAKSGLVTTNTPGKVGGFEGADFLIYGTITSLQVINKADIGSTLLVGILSGNRGNTQACANAYATLGLDIKITDASTGEVRYVTHIDETQKSEASCSGQAHIDAALLERSAAAKVATGLITAIFPIQVAAVQPDGVMILNYGEGTLLPGAVLTLYSKGDAIRDPASGEILANNESKLGYIRVTEVNGRISRATPASQFDTAPPIGAIVRPASAEDIAMLAKQSQKRR
jgi:curli biogenesis system outer membrane secretion channel CsgG